MKKRILLFALLSAALLIPGPGTGKAKAGPTHVTYYTVHYVCIIGPPPPDPVGEWELDCDGTWNGWGMLPGEGCTSSDITYGDSCIIKTP